MSTITVYGASDDLIEVEGAITEEFPYRRDDDSYLAFADGTLLRVDYTPSGVWRIERVVNGSMSLRHVQAPEDDESNYSDRVTLDADVDGEVAWVVYGSAFAMRNR